MSNTDIQTNTLPTLSTPETSLDTFPVLRAGVPFPPSRGEQSFRDEPITRRPLPEETLGARIVLQELVSSPLPASIKGVPELVHALQGAAAFREELHRTLDWLDFVKASDAYAWNRVLELLASSSDRIQAAFLVDPALGEAHPELRRLLERRTKVVRRGRARRSEAARKAAKKEVKQPK